MRFPKRFVTSGALADMRELTGGDMRVLWVVVALADNTGTVTMTQGELQDGTGLSRAAVETSTKRLRTLGLLAYEGVKGRPTTYTVTSKMTTTAVNEMTNSRVIRGRPADTDMTSTAVISVSDMTTPVVKSLERPSRAVHPYEENARKGLITLARERHIPNSLDELLRYAYKLGTDGDPWDGYLRIKKITEAPFTGSQNIAAVVRSRLEKAA